LRDSLPQRASILRSLARSLARGCQLPCGKLLSQNPPSLKTCYVRRKPIWAFSHFSKKIPLLIIIIIIIITNITISGGQWNPSFVCIWSSSWTKSLLKK
jgi:hypothetical protein